MSQKNIRINETFTKKDMSEIKNEFCNRYSSDDSVRRAVGQAKYDRFIHLLGEITKKQEEQEELVLSQNGALEYASTGSALVDFNARATEFRNAKEEIIIDAARKAYEENPVDFVKLIFQTGDIRGGKGERHTFNCCMDWLVAEHPIVAREVLMLIPEFTRWDYLVRQTVSKNKEVSELATAMVAGQLKEDLEKASSAKAEEKINISLLAKWMPSLQTKKSEEKAVVRHLLRSLHMQEREYRKTLSMLRERLNVIEKALSVRNYSSIEMEKLSSKQQLRYSRCLSRVMAEKRHEYIQAVLRGEKKMNASVLNPVEIIHEYVKGRFYCDYNEDYEALWSLIPDKTSGNGNTLVIRDGSGSMMSPIGQGSRASMLEAATAMAIYCAEHLTGAFKNKFITFSSRPKLLDLSKYKSLSDKIKYTYSKCDCSNTDIEATFDLVLDTAVRNNLTQEEIPAYLMILSDMEFDVARANHSIPRKTLFGSIREKWNRAGYEIPTLVFWQLNGARTLYPEIDAENGVIFLSGFSTNELELVMAGKYEVAEEVEEEIQTVDKETGNIKTEVKKTTIKRILSPAEQLKLKLSDPRYNVVEAAARLGLERENA